jgi:hypothetical protein
MPDHMSESNRLEMIERKPLGASGRGSGEGSETSSPEMFPDRRLYEVENP